MKKILIGLVLVSAMSSFAQEAEKSCIQNIDMTQCYNAFVVNEENTGAVEGYICSAEIVFKNGDREYVEGVRSFEPTKLTERLYERSNDQNSKWFVRATSAVGVVLIEIPRGLGKIVGTKKERGSKIRAIIKKHGLCDSKMELR